MLQTVTLTGADDSIRPAELADLSEEFPFVEWGILCSASKAGVPRFPSYKWMTHLRHLAQRGKVRLALHLCGRQVSQ